MGEVAGCAQVRLPDSRCMTALLQMRSDIVKDPAQRSAAKASQHIVIGEKLGSPDIFVKGDLVGATHVADGDVGGMSSG